MKRQYRYKTAATTKDFFTRDWFNELDDKAGELNDAIDGVFRNKSVFQKIKNTLFMDGPDEIIEYIDAYAFPKDSCQKIMSILANYEAWYSDAWSFLEKDSYDKLKESINRCDFIKANLTKFAEKKGAEVTDELKKIKNNIEQLHNVASGSATTISDGYDNSKNNEIIKFLKEVGTGSEVEKKLLEMSELLEEFINDVNSNAHYWVKSADKDSGSEIFKRADDVKAELDEELKNKREDLKNKREDAEEERVRSKEERRRKDEDAEEERKKKREKRMEEEYEYEPYDIAMVMSTINPIVTKMKDVIKEMCNKFYDLYTPMQETLNGLGVSDKKNWKKCCDDFFNKALYRKLENNFTEKKINTHLSNGNLVDYLKKTENEINDAFGKTREYQLLDLETTGDAIKEYKLGDTEKIRTLKDLRSVLQLLFKWMNEALRHHVL